MLPADETRELLAAEGLSARNEDALLGEEFEAELILG